jgi:hypothetical protein
MPITPTPKLISEWNYFYSFFITGEKEHIMGLKTASNRLLLLRKMSKLLECLLS